MRRAFLKAILGIPAFAAVTRADQFDSGAAFRSVPIGKLKHPEIMVPLFYNTKLDALYYFADGAWHELPKGAKEN